MNTHDSVPLLVNPDESYHKPSVLRHWTVPLVINLAVAVAVLMVIDSGLRFAVAAVLVAGGFVTARTYWVSGELATGRISLLDGRGLEGTWELAGLSNVVLPRKWVPFSGGGVLTLTRTGAEQARAYIVSDGRSSTGFRSAIDWDEASAAPLIEAAREHGYTVRFEE